MQLWLNSLLVGHWPLNLDTRTKGLRCWLEKRQWKYVDSIPEFRTYWLFSHLLNSGCSLSWGLLTQDSDIQWAQLLGQWFVDLSPTREVHRNHPGVTPKPLLWISRVKHQIACIQATHWSLWPLCSVSPLTCSWAPHSDLSWQATGIQFKEACDF